MSIVCGERKMGQCSLFLCGMSLCGLCWKACWDLEDRPAGRGKGEQQCARATSSTRLAGLGRRATRRKGHQGQAQRKRQEQESMACKRNWKNLRTGGQTSESREEDRVLRLGSDLYGLENQFILMLSKKR